jgi:hypothetical protein
MFHVLYIPIMAIRQGVTNHIFQPTRLVKSSRERVVYSRDLIVKIFDIVSCCVVLCRSRVVLKKVLESFSTLDIYRVDPFFADVKDRANNGVKGFSRWKRS